jgi:hypothetical protein
VAAIHSELREVGREPSGRAVVIWSLSSPDQQWIFCNAEAVSPLLLRGNDGTVKGSLRLSCKQ